MTIATLTEILGWCTVINIGLLLYMTVMITVFHGFVKGVHQKLFPLPDANIEAAYFSFLANYKLLVLMFNLVPYCALKIIA